VAFSDFAAHFLTTSADLGGLAGFNFRCRRFQQGHGALLIIVG
jgi:hypothetical protein